MSESKSFIQQAVYYTTVKNVFVGNLLQELDIKVSKHVPTAALAYNKNMAKFEILIGEEFFKSLTIDQRVAVLLHELAHFTNGHIFRFKKMGTEKEHSLMNIAADMAINQYIQNLPENCINVEKWKDTDGSPMPKYQTTEFYFDVLRNTTQQPQDGQGDQGDPQDGNEKGDGSGGGQQATPSESMNWEEYKKYKPFDPHEWGDEGQELDTAEKERMLQEAKKVVERTIDKTYQDFSLAPDSAKDLLKEIEGKLRQLNYKGLLRYAIRKSVTTNKRASTWHRPNKRYGSFAPGSTNDKAPQLDFYIDMSGSISHTEANQFLGVMNGFLGTGYQYCHVGFWHTKLYQFRKYKRDTPIREDDMESGGTDPTCVFENIEKRKSNLSIILTDGCYDQTKYRTDQKIIWIISAGGNVDHPYKHIGLTIKLEDLK